MSSNPRQASVVRSTRDLVPVLGLFSAFALVIGEVIGSGIFFMPRAIAAAMGDSVGLILALWVGAGLVNLCGALTLAELSAMMPHTGGTYVFLREAYGRTFGFLWCWAEFWVIRSGAIATLAAALAIGLDSFWRQLGSETQVPDPLQKMVAIGGVVVLATVNIVGTRWGGWVQNVTTVVKIGFLVFLAALPFTAASGPRIEVDFGAVDVPGNIFAALGASLFAIMWTYDGWGQVTVVAGEIRNPRRNVPLALAGGVIVLIVLYTAVNLAYHWTLSTDALAASPSPTIDVTRRLFGDFGARLVAALIMVSVFGALNSNILVGPRALYATARDNAFMRPLRHVDPRFGTPAIAIGSLSLWAVVLIFATDFGRNPEERLYEVLAQYTIFGGSLFYLASVVAVFVLRRTAPDADRPYRTFGYPFVPIVFVVAYVLMLASMLWSKPGPSLQGLGVIVAGGFVYLLVPKRFRQGEDG